MLLCNGSNGCLIKSSSRFRHAVEIFLPWQQVTLRHGRSLVATHGDAKEDLQDLVGGFQWPNDGSNGVCR